VSESPSRQAADAPVSGLEVVRAVAIHLLLGVIWFFAAVFIWLGRYLFCSNEPDILAPLVVGMAIVWALSLFVVGLIRYRGIRTWPWSLASLFVGVAIFTIAVYSGPEPHDCYLFVVTR
jgi:hypothetical protein